MCEIERFYRNLYTKRPVSNPTVFLNNLDHTSLSTDDSLLCEGDLTLIECREALFSMASNKSPGSDGFSNDFYKYFWDEVGILVLNSLNFAYNTHNLSSMQSQAIISLFAKPGKDPLNLNNWRPIALLNTDYKIGAKCIASRLKNVINNLISNEQTGFLKGRYIGENIRLVLDSIEYCKLNNIRGSFIFLDYAKAFDSLDRTFIDHVLSYFKFGNSFRLWIKTLYSNATSCVINNGFQTNFFPIARGVRQGCPLSPYRTFIYYVLKFYV